MERQASTGVPSRPVTRSAPSAARAPEPRIAMPLSPRTAAELLAEVRAAEAEARVLRARWGLDAVAVDSSSRLRLRDTGQERRRAAKSSTGSSSSGLTATRKSRITTRFFRSKFSRLTNSPLNHSGIKLKRLGTRRKNCNCAIACNWKA